MNIHFQVCGLCIIFLMIVFYTSHRNLNFYKERAFFGILCFSAVNLIFDILSLAAIVNRSILPPLFVSLLCKIYIITLLWLVWFALIYIISDITSPKKHKSIAARAAIFVAFQSIVVLCLPIYIYDDGIQTYTYGPAVLCIYAFVGIYILETLAVTFLYRKVLNPRRKFAILIWMLIWALSAIIQFFNSGLLLVGFAGALGVLILFMVMENPEGNIERQLGCFNSYALTEYLKQLYEDACPFSVLKISLTNRDGIEKNGMNTDVVIRQLLPLCGKTALAFKDVNPGLILIGKSAQTLQQTQAEIAHALASTQLDPHQISFALVPQAEALATPDALIRFLSFLEREQSEKAGSLVVADDAMICQYQNRLMMEREIALALEQDRVEVFLQPIYSPRENRFTSAEALVRIRREDGTLLPPGLFIPVAESNGQIIALGDRVFEKVCWLLKNTDAVNNGLHYVEINLSVVQCEKMNLAEHLIAITEKYQVDPRLINLEITETASISAGGILLENMKKLISNGFTFSLDDFGKGQSNLMYVVEMPVSIIKLDYDMIQAFFRAPKAKQVVRAVVGMAHDMGLKIIAEGIETQQEAEQMIRENVDSIQGFHYAKPIPMDEFLEFILCKNQ